jgi:hypothetical protein
MAYLHSVEQAITEAMARGEFDNLPGKGKPLDLDAYFAAPEEWRMAYSVLRSAGYLPEEVQLLKEIAVLKEKLAACTDEPERERLGREIQQKNIAFRELVERYRRPRRG